MPRYKLKDKKAQADLVNRDIVRISRVVVHPKFRGAGLAVKLVRDTMPLTGARVVETLAAMAQYNPFFEKAGMTKVGRTRLTPALAKLVKTVKAMGGDPGMLHSPIQRETFINGLSEKRRERLATVLAHAVSALSGQADRGHREARSVIRRTALGGLGALLGDMIRATVERVYLYWERDVAT